MPAVDLSDEQEAVLGSILSNRLTVVRAGPGSGKTRVFVEALKRFLDMWKSHRRGIAALSFTNVAREVITDRLGGPPGSPHYVGTIDSFLLRYVLRPFGHLVGVAGDGVVLVPAPVDRSLAYPAVAWGAEPGETAPLYRFTFSGGGVGDPRLKRQDRFGSTVEVDLRWREKILDAKWKMWRSKGLVTHSDSHYLAATVLASRYRDRIVALVASRFPVILVDEFQDTGRFLGEALLELLRSEAVRGALVGDPDQAIFQFGGANREVFLKAEALPGAVSATLTTSFRCSRAVANVASALSRTGKPVVAREGAPPGRAVMLVRDPEIDGLDVGATLTALQAAFDVDAGSSLGVLARRRTWVQEMLAGRAPTQSGPWRSGFPFRLSQATVQMLRGEPAHAARTVNAALADVVFSEEAMSGRDLRGRLAERGIPPSEWRRAVHAILTDAMRSIPGETWNAWMRRLKTTVETEAVKMGWARDARQLGHRFRRNPEGERERPAPEPAPIASVLPGTNVMTIHAAKGREFDTVIVVAPKPHATHAPCPSVEWWSEDPGAEEREVAFVACSRARDSLLLSVHPTTFAALSLTQPRFLSLFEVINAAPLKPPPCKQRRRSTSKEVAPQTPPDGTPGSRDP